MTDLTLYLPNYNASHSALFDELFAVTPPSPHQEQPLQRQQQRFQAIKLPLTVAYRFQSAIPM